MAAQDAQPWNQGGFMPGLHATVPNGNAYAFERGVIACLTQRWPNMSTAQCSSVRQYMARWGPMSRPVNPAPGTEDFGENEQSLFYFIRC
jgi:hypothetical protein